MKYSVHSSGQGTNDSLQFDEGPFQGIIFRYNSVQVAEVEEEYATLTFDYDVLGETKPNDLVAFEQTLGQLLQEMIMKGIEENSIVYTGGTD